MSPPSAAPLLWGRLRPGPHPVGYTARAEIDATRPGDAAGRRAVDVRLWYPADPSAATPAMEYAAYLSPGDGPARESATVRDLAERTLTLLREDLLDDADDALQSLLGTPTAARRDAHPAAGPHPLVVYAGGLNSGAEENSVLAEYLASHGFVVAAVVSAGEGWMNASPDAVSVDLARGDLALARTAARSWLGAEPAATAAAGFSLGAVAAIGWRMRQPAVDAVVALDPSFCVARHHALPAADPFWSPARARAPMLVLHAEYHDTDLAVVESLVHAERHVERMPGMRHVDFTAYAAVLDEFGASGGTPASAAGRRGYERACRRVRAFLDARLRGGTLPRGPLRMAATPAPPDDGALAREARRGGPHALRRLLRATAARHPDAPVLQEEALERLGAGLWSAGMRQEAVALSIWAARRAPDSLRLQRLAGEVLERTGRRAPALRAWRRALRLAGDDASAAADISRRIENLRPPPDAR